MNRAEAHNGDEAWITKYREALKVTPVKTSSFKKLRIALKNVSGIVLSLLRRALNRGAQRDLRRSIPAGAVPTTVPMRSSTPQRTETELIAERAIKKPNLRTGRPKLVKPRRKRPAQRPA
jgi:hypothetical protein